MIVEPAALARLWGKVQGLMPKKISDLTNDKDFISKGEIGKSLSERKTEYYLSDTSSTPIGGRWSENPPTWVQGKYLFLRETKIYVNGETALSPPVCISGSKGEQGIMGLQGERGNRGIAGTNGINGQTTFFHIRYSPVESPLASQMTETPDEFIGTYVDFMSADSDDPQKYHWARFRGIQGQAGEKGIPGVNGADGKTSYLHIKYADVPNPGIGQMNDVGGAYIGSYTDFKELDSTDPALYTWTKIKGESGRSVDSIQAEYAVGDSLESPPTLGWSQAKPPWEKGSFIWSRSKISYKDPDFTDYTQPFCTSEAADKVADDLGGSIEQVYTELYDAKKELGDTDEEFSRKMSAILVKRVKIGEDEDGNPIFQDEDGEIANISQEIQQTAEDVTLRFVKNYVEKDENIEKFSSYVTFSSGEDILESPQIKLGISNSLISLHQNGNEIAMISGKKIISRWRANGDGDVDFLCDNGSFDDINVNRTLSLGGSFTLEISDGGIQCIYSKGNT